MLFFEPIETWESSTYDDRHPFQRFVKMCDIMNVHLKTGSETLKVIEKQLEGIGIFRLDNCGEQVMEEEKMKG